MARNSAQKLADTKKVGDEHMATKVKIKIKCAIWLTLIVLVGCTNRPPLYPTYEELKHHGFYVYVLPETITADRQWQQRIHIWSFNRHCKGLGNEADNPLSVSYSTLITPDDLRRSVLFRIEMGNPGWAPPYVNPNQKVAMVEIASPLVIGRVLQYCPDDKTQTTLVFTDAFGVRVYITADFPLTDTIALIQQLEYVGPNTNTLTISPWSCDQ